MSVKATREVKSVCPYCGVGCGLLMQVADNRIIGVTGDPGHPSNAGRLCTKGKSCAEAITAPGRLEQAYLRSDRQHEPARVAMDHALRESARRLRAIIDNHGPDAVALYVSGQMSLEAQYLANKLTKGFIGTNNIESNSRLCMASAASGYKLSLGSDGPPGSYDDFDRADLFFVIGANMADCHPILFLRMMDRVKAGAKLIVVDPRRTATAEKASLFLQITPGTDLSLLNGLLALLVANERIDREFIDAFTEGWQTMPDFLQDYTPQQVAARTGLAEADIHQAAQWIGEAGEWMSCWTMGLNQSTHGTWSTNALCNLHLATGAICRPGSGPFSLTGQPNAMGGREMGYMGGGLPGQRSVLVAQDRAFVERLWQRPAGTLRHDIGDGTVALFEEMSAGKVKACWIICTNPVATVPNRQKVIAGLQQAELVIAQDAFLDSETNRYADILLPGALWAEAEGVMINSERNMTLMPQAVSPPGDAMADWQIIARIACEMGYQEGFSYASADEVFDEIRQANNPATGYDIRGVSYTRLRDGPIQWPFAPEETRTRSPIRYLQDAGQIRFATPSGKGQFFARPDLALAEMPDEDFPFVLNTGRVQHQWHTLTKTGKIPMLNKLNPGPFIEIHPQDAERLGIKDKDRVDIVSRRGRATLPAVVTDRVRPGNGFAPFHWNDLFGDDIAINVVTSDAVDPISLQPELKHAAVALERSALQPEIRWAGEPPAVLSEPDATSVLVLWASTTGTAETFADACVRRLQQVELTATPRCMDSVGVAEIAAASRVLLIASTFGDGDPPDNGAALWAALADQGAPSLAETAFSVLAFGDTRYERFCGFGRRLDSRLAELGAQRLTARVDCDADGSGAAQRWLDALLPQLTGQAVEAAPVTNDVVAGYSRHAPLMVPLVGNRRLNAPESEREIRQFTFDLRDSGLRYQAGDALGVWPLNCPERVAEFIEALGLSPQTSVTVGEHGEMALREALLRHYDISRITPDMLAFVQAWAKSETLDVLLSSGHEAELKQWLWGRQIIDLLRMFPVRVDISEWLAVLRPLQPRLYSISSGPTASPEQVALTVSTVRYGDNKEKGGVCSTWLADRAESAEIFIQSSAHFHLPTDPQTPIIMVGAGTGIAPFHGFLQEREATAAPGRSWLFFGEQYSATDFYYRDALEEWLKNGVLTRLDTAFSRDGTEKIYVQQRMLEQGAELWRWLRDGAFFYICGDASRMAKDVDLALKQVVQTHGNMRADEASRWVEAMAKEKRYRRDVY
ncbi:sulfite reductase (NADPH) alpha subunit [Enterobacter sp. BIGb0383]|uniref:bifunctional nitrate reductase/sulfite reductase flavoprotein subunit alpha n=1 Tax=unclassified Enterobacter TaxID=2608935 RepID=UPI000F477EE0|nr:MULTISPECIES: bifunctional nitrate reductase/sulfite reductase flavoprotein subunit alpha [unclassified Enterobacter]ROP59664.1 sulfite reductase (NADPH) alpha subunit [Enterobacter sp. BIGb0383]ROS08868.1 sulfite reductase (NADPH) alpha subunit [Enterobacter sp. BIGb0359]